MIAPPRRLIVGLAAAFSLYHLVLAVYALGGDYERNHWPVIAAMLLYAVATALLLVPGRTVVVPLWAAAVATGVGLSMILLVSSVLDPGRPGGNGYATWYVAAVGTLMTIAVTRRRTLLAWLGTGILVVHTVMWAGPAALGTLGVIGSVSWVAVAHIMSVTLERAARDSERLARAEREAVAWEAAQEAYLGERRARLEETRRVALPLLTRIVAADGDLDAAGRRECLRLEATLRDEIRGRNLLDDRVRRELRHAREGGVEVALLDEGGLDDAEEETRERIHGSIAEAIAAARVDADRVIVRTDSRDSPTAVTVVGLRTSAGPGGDGEGGDEVVLWQEIPWIASE